MVRISKQHYRQMIEQAEKEFPNECCGLLAGILSEDEIEIKDIYSMRNTDQSSQHFTMDPKEQFAAMKKMRAEGYILTGNYHSHPYTPSRPSEEDKRLAFDAGMIYGIISLMDEEPTLNFFKIIDHKDVVKLDWTFQGRETSD
ncbi:MAG: Mov34/MPN/PAD-1 family protein [Bacillota bacterium]